MKGTWKYKNVGLDKGKALPAFHCFVFSKLQSKKLPNLLSNYKYGTEAERIPDDFKLLSEK